MTKFTRTTATKNWTYEELKALEGRSFVSLGGRTHKVKTKPYILKKVEKLNGEIVITTYHPTNPKNFTKQRFIHDWNYINRQLVTPPDSPIKLDAQKTTVAPVKKGLKNILEKPSVKTAPVYVDKDTIIIKIGNRTITIS